MVERYFSLNKLHTDCPTGGDVHHIATHHIALMVVCLVLGLNGCFQSYQLYLQSWDGPHCARTFLAGQLISPETCAYSENIYVCKEDFNSCCFLKKIIQHEEVSWKSTFLSKAALIQNFNKLKKRFFLQLENASLNTQTRYWVCR